MAINFVLRFVWILSMSPEIVYRFIRPELFSLFIFSLEVVRRAIWNIIRVELKHLEICKQFKVSMNIDLPFKKNNDGTFRLKDNNIASFIKLNQRISRLSPKFIDNIDIKQLIGVNYESFARNSDPEISGTLSKYLENCKKNNLII